MKTNTFKYAMNGLGHPLVMLGLALVLLNALWLQPQHPGWLSGKLGDLGWMLCAPFLLALPLSLLLRSRRALGWAALGFTGVLFALLKTIPAANEAARSAWLGLTGFQLKLALDPSDLLALVGLIPAAWAWFRPVFPAPRLLRAAGVGLMSLAILADSAGPMYMGVKCVAVRDGQMLAFAEFQHTSGYVVSKTNVYWNVFTSEDGGLTWTNSSTFSLENREKDPLYADLDAMLDACGTGPASGWIEDPFTAGGSYLVTDGEAVYRSTDNRATLVRDLELDQDDSLTSYAFDAQSHGLLLGLGLGGIAVHTADGWLRPDLLTSY